MSDPVSENGTAWHDLPGATGGIRVSMSSRPTSQLVMLEKILLTPFARIAAGLTGGDPEDWDTINEIIENIIGPIKGILDSVVAGIISGGIALGGAAIGTAVSVADAIVDLIKNVAGAILGGGSRAAAAGLPSSFTAGALRDIADGQAALIGQLEALEDNAGFCNVTASYDGEVTGYKNTFLDVRYDTYVTAHKNAQLVHNGLTGRDFLTLMAPGVWIIDSLVTVDPGTTGSQYYEAEVVVWRGSIGSSYVPGRLSGQEVYSKTRYPDTAVSTDPFSIKMHKPVVIPDFTYGASSPTEWKWYSVIVQVRFRDSTAWSMLGGTLHSSLSVNRLSTDATNYAPPETSVGSTPITP